MSARAPCSPHTCGAFIRARVFEFPSTEIVEVSCSLVLSAAFLVYAQSIYTLTWPQTVQFQNGGVSDFVCTPGHNPQTKVMDYPPCVEMIGPMTRSVRLSVVRSVELSVIVS